MKALEKLLYGRRPKQMIKIILNTRQQIDHKANYLIINKLLE